MSNEEIIERIMSALEMGVEVEEIEDLDEEEQMLLKQLLQSMKILMTYMISLLETTRERDISLSI